MPEYQVRYTETDGPMKHIKKVVPRTYHTFNFVTTSGQETLQIYRHKICWPLNRVRPFPWESVQQENMSSVHASCHF